MRRTPAPLVREIMTTPRPPVPTVHAASRPPTAAAEPTGGAGNEEPPARGAPLSEGPPRRRSKVDGYKRVTVLVPGPSGTWRVKACRGNTEVFSHGWQYRQREYGMKLVAEIEGKLRTSKQWTRPGHQFDSIQLPGSGSQRPLRLARKPCRKRRTLDFRFVPSANAFWSNSLSLPDGQWRACGRVVGGTCGQRRFAFRQLIVLEFRTFWRLRWRC
jgi:hypothetical protein